MDDIEDIRREEGAERREDSSLLGVSSSSKWHKNPFCRTLLIWLAAIIVIGGITGALVMREGNVPSPLPPPPSEPLLTFDQAMNIGPRGLGDIAWVHGLPSSWARRETTGDIVLVDALTGEEELLMKASELKDPDTQKVLVAQGWWVSPKAEVILVCTEKKAVYRHSFTGVFFRFNITSKSTSAVKNKERIRWATWTSGSTQLTLIDCNNNLWMEEQDGRWSQLTNDGVEDFIFNGMPDWANEEEIWSSASALWWNDDGSRLAFVRYDASFVEKAHIPQYQLPYAHQFSYRYPEPGTNNSKIRVLVWDRFTSTTVSAALDPALDAGDALVTFVGWIDEKNIAVRVANRAQNTTDVYVVHANGTVLTCLAHTESTGWLEPTPLLLLGNRKEWVDIISKRAVLRDLETGDVKMNLTPPNVAVDDLVFAQDHMQGAAALISTAEPDPTYRSLFWISLETGERHQVHGKESTWNSASVSPEGNFLIVNENAPPVPSIVLYETSSDQAPARVRVLEANDALRKEMDSVALPLRVFTTLPSAQDGIALHARLWIPNASITQCHHQYPVLVNVYGGPGSQTVMQRWELGWPAFLASQGIVIVNVDGRGTGFRSESFEHAVRGRLGVLEALDQIAAARGLRSLCYVDPSRVMLWGWSYGGFMTLRVASEETSRDVFSGFMAVAPVTDWRLYDTIYTERYMDLLSSNEEGYEATSLIHRQFAERPLFLVHGTADDNVRFLHSMLLLDQLVEKGFSLDSLQLMVYPNRHHGIEGTNAHRHVYWSLARFAANHLLGNNLCAGSVPPGTINTAALPVVKRRSGERRMLERS